ncbi:hypothetical protein [Sagittula salina]|uniref:Glycosyl transferase family 2 n=1 Tax=Sagittula salina TaxID=2820268 RepID=A0A940S0I8_9RHOB|nr:hypothetical protein [Sagittula salina]MBP0483123.1 hypothetical protein [Sagittula salina]
MAETNSRVVVSLTTIPSRAATLRRTIDSIWAQDPAPAAIEVNIPREYSRRSMGRLDVSDLPKNCDVQVVDRDYGPATKILPTVARHRGQDVRLVYGDDDRIYGPGWLARLLSASDAHPDDVITERWVSSRAKENRYRWGRKGALYVFLRKASFGRFEPLGRHFVHDIAEGCGGVLIRPHFLGDEAFDIPDILWTVDDVWLSGHFWANGHRVIHSGVAFGDTAQDLVEEDVNIRDLDALYLYETQGHGRLAANAACIRYMRRRYGVFAGPRRNRTDR